MGTDLSHNRLTTILFRPIEVNGGRCGHYITSCIYGWSRQTHCQQCTTIVDKVPSPSLDPPSEVKRHGSLHDGRSYWRGTRILHAAVSRLNAYRISHVAYSALCRVFMESTSRLVREPENLTNVMYNGLIFWCCVTVVANMVYLLNRFLSALGNWCSSKVTI